MPGDGREDYMEMSKAQYERRIGMGIDEYLHRMLKKRAAKNAAANRAESLAERIRLNVEEATNHQIMVENIKVFEREYFAMMARRSC